MQIAFYGFLLRIYSVGVYKPHLPSLRSHSFPFARKYHGKGIKLLHFLSRVTDPSFEE